MKKATLHRFIKVLFPIAITPVFATEVVVQTGDEGTSHSGGWYYAGAATQDYYGNKGMYASVSAAQKTYTFSANLATTSRYRVEVYNTCYSPRSTQVRYHVHSAGDSDTVVADQDCATDPFVGSWRPLGEYAFNAGGTASVVIDSTGSNNSYLGATAVRFTSLNIYQQRLAPGESTWLPFVEYYDGAATCASPAQVTGLPPGLAFDTVCNLYGTPSSSGEYTALVPLSDGTSWQVEFVIQSMESDELATELPANPATGSSATLDVQRSLQLGERLWMPYTSFYSGGAQCGGSISNLPPGLAFDTVCNIYGTPSASGDFQTTVPLDDGSSWTIAITVVDSSMGGSTPEPPGDNTQDETSDNDSSDTNENYAEDGDVEEVPTEESPDAPQDEEGEPAPVVVDTQATDLENPVLFALVVPPLRANSFGYQLETFANHQTGMINQSPRGGDLALMDTQRNIRLLTREAGYGVDSGELQTENAIAVRQPSVHWDGSRALFSMLVGGPIRAFDQSYRQNRWQIYELTNLDAVIEGAQPNIILVVDQPAAYNNISPVYGADNTILFTSDAPLYSMNHTYPQYDEYESTVTNTGIFKLDRVTGVVTHLSHSPSGDFDLSIASDGRVISTRWEHLKRDQQASNHRAGNVPWAPVTYESEQLEANIISAPAFVDGKPYADADGTPYEIFPGAFVHIVNGIEVEPNRDPNEPLHDFNEFLPWEVSQFGEGHQTMNHVGRHEFGGSFANGSKLDDPNLSFLLGGLTQNDLRSTVGSDAGIFQIKEDPRPGFEGTFYGTWAEEFGRFASGRIFEFSLPAGRNPQDMEIIDWTNPLIDNEANNLGHFRNPLMTMSGTMLASYAPQSGVFGSSDPEVYQFRIVKMLRQNPVSASTEHIPSQPLTGDPIMRDIVYWGDSTSPQIATVVMNEVDVVEVVARTQPAQPQFKPIDTIEQQVLVEEGVDENALRSWMIDNKLALIVVRNMTERDAGERQQPFNLRVPGGVESTPEGGKVYDISHFQIFSAELIRSYGMRNFNGRRVIATPLRNSAHHPELINHNVIDPESPVESGIRIASDGSLAAFVPATRAMTWQSVAPDGEPIVRERQWVTFAPGEVRTCAGCHGINDLAMSGNEAPTNKPEALRELMRHWKQVVE